MLEVFVKRSGGIVGLVGDRRTWDEFLQNHAAAHFFHTWQWGEIIKKTWGGQILRLGFFKDENLVGLFPISVLPFSVVGSIAASMPVYVYAGPLVSENSLPEEKEEAIEALVRRADSEIRQRRVLSFRTLIWSKILDPQKTVLWEDLGYAKEEGHCYVYSLPPHRNQIDERYSKGFRYSLNRSRKTGNTVLINEAIDLEAVYSLYCETMHRASTRPRYPKRLLEYVYQLGPEWRDFYMCYGKTAKLAAFAVALKTRLGVIYWLAGMDRQAASDGPMHLIVDNLIQESWKGKKEWIDFGGASTEGLRYFKQSIGAQPEPLLQFYKVFSPFCKKLAYRIHEFFPFEIVE